MAGGTGGEAQSRPSMASPMAFMQSTCSCVDLVLRGVWGCLAYHLGFCEDWADDRSKKEEINIRDREEHEEEVEETKTRKREEHEEEGETKTRKREEHEEGEEDDQTGTRTREVHEEDGIQTEANGGTENFGVMLRRGPRRPGIDKGGGGQVN